MAIRIRDLIEAGAHFGHPVSRWHPKMAPFIYGKRNLIHIIDLRQTVRGILRAQHFLQNMVADGGKVLLVGTKRQAKATISGLAKQSGMPWVAERWPGGMLTNFSTVRSRLARLEELEELEETGAINRYSKKMISSMRREKRKILRNLDGVRTMTELPAALLVVDPRHENNAIREARTLGIPTVAIIDTDCDPGLVDIPVPANDDAFRSVQMILATLVEAVEVGKRVWDEKQEIARKKQVEEEERQRKIREAREARRREEAEKAAKVKAAQEKMAQEKAAAEKAAKAAAEQPAEKPAEKAAEKPAAKPAGQPAETPKPAPKATAKPVAKPVAIPEKNESAVESSSSSGEDSVPQEVPAAPAGETPASGSS